MIWGQAKMNRMSGIEVTALVPDAAQDEAAASEVKRLVVEAVREARGACEEEDVYLMRLRDLDSGEISYQGTWGPKSTCPVFILDGFKEGCVISIDDWMGISGYEIFGWDDRERMWIARWAE